MHFKTYVSKRHITVVSSFNFSWWLHSYSVTSLRFPGFLSVFLSGEMRLILHPGNIGEAVEQEVKCCGN